MKTQNCNSNIISLPLHVQFQCSFIKNQEQSVGWSYYTDFNNSKSSLE